MAQLFYKFGAMKSGKSMDLIKTKINYDRVNRNAIVVKPSLDTRDGNSVNTRLGSSIEATLLSGEKLEIINIIKNERKEGRDVRAVLIDEAQFLTRQQVMEITTIVDILNIPVLCWGLKTNFKGELFEGSKALIEFADKIEEIKTLCEYCERKATMNLRLKRDEEGILTKADYNDDEIMIGDSEYVQVCRKHFLH